jgi:hypothetical protein
LHLILEKLILFVARRLHQLHLPVGQLGLPLLELQLLLVGGDFRLPVRVLRMGEIGLRLLHRAFGQLDLPRTSLQPIFQIGELLVNAVKFAKRDREIGHASSPRRVDFP